MTSTWYDCISTELEKVETVMEDVISIAENPLLREMCHYVLTNHGKRVRPALCLLAFHLLGGEDSKRAIDVGSAIELIHNATLVHDDINDEGEMRRGAKALYKEYSLGRSIVAGDFMFALGFQLMGTTSNDVVHFVISAAAAMGSGEFDQKKYERNVAADEAQYLKIITGKTARLLECAAKCGAYLAAPDDLESVEKVGNFAYNIGLSFQIIDDLLDVIGDSKNTGKLVGNDLVEGKPTLPTIYAMQDPTYGARVREIFENPSADYSDAAEAIELIKKTDSIDRCFALAKHYADLALKDLESFKDSSYKQSMIDFANFIVSRDR
ncbi:MAG: polyprenyl synthetase family protein [archaeon]|nr:polyprenyl synthetase family protein [archaeon]